MGIPYYTRLKHIGGVVIIDDLEKDQRILKEINRLKKLFKNIPKDKMNSVMVLIKNAAFMTITLEDLQEAINRDGTISKYQNGANQWGTKKSPEVDIYNTMIKNLTSVIKQLADLILDTGPPPTKELDAFQKIASRGKGG